MVDKPALGRVERFIAPYRVIQGRGFRFADTDPADTHRLGAEDEDDAKTWLSEGVRCLAQAQDRWSVLLVLQAMDVTRLAAPARARAPWHLHERGHGRVDRETPDGAADHHARGLPQVPDHATGECLRVDARPAARAIRSAAAAMATIDTRQARPSGRAG